MFFQFVNKHHEKTKVNGEMIQLKSVCLCSQILM